MNRLFIIVYPLLQGRGGGPPKNLHTIPGKSCCVTFILPMVSLRDPKSPPLGDQVGSRTESLGISEVFLKCWFPSCCDNWHLHSTPNTASFMLLFWGHILKHTHTHLYKKNSLRFSLKITKIK